MKAAWWKAPGSRGNTSGGISDDASGRLKTGWTMQHEVKESREWWHWGRRDSWSQASERETLR